MGPRIRLEMIQMATPLAEKEGGRELQCLILSFKSFLTVYLLFIYLLKPSSTKGLLFTTPRC